MPLVLKTLHGLHFVSLSHRSSPQAFTDMYRTNGWLLSERSPDQARPRERQRFVGIAFPNNSDREDPFATGHWHSPAFTPWNVDFHGSRVTSEGGLLRYRSWTNEPRHFIARQLGDARARNTQFGCATVLRSGCEPIFNRMQ